MKIIKAHFAELPKFQHKPAGGIPHKHKEVLLAGFHEYHEQVLTAYKEEYTAFMLRKKAFDTKRCQYCGSPLRWVEGFSFWGCSNYRTEGEHSSFNYDPSDRPQPKVRVNADWVSSIIKAKTLSGKVTAKKVLEFFLSEGLPDLRTEYDYKKATMDKINNLIKTNQRSKKQEAEALQLLRGLFSKVVPQQCITYQLDDGFESFCIPDFICGNEEQVVVVDAKLDYPDDAKMDLYVALIKHILEGKGDKRNVSGAHVMYWETEQMLYNKGKYPIYTIS